jgi:hypothetical protein
MIAALPDDSGPRRNAHSFTRCRAKAMPESVFRLQLPTGWRVSFMGSKAVPRGSNSQQLPQHDTDSQRDTPPGEQLELAAFQPIDQPKQGTQSYQKRDESAAQ